MTDMRVSIICPCKDRDEPLQTAIHSWLAHEEVVEIIITDWSSKKSLNYLTKISDKIKVITVKGEEYFNMQQPLNLALSVATGDYILKMDTDYILNTYPEFNFFNAVNLGDNSYFCGEYVSNDGKKNEVAESHYVKYLRGILFVKREHLLKVGGYNDNFGDYYGNDDGEVNQRLSLLGLKRKTFNEECPFYTMIHMPHKNKRRYENFKAFNENKSEEQAIRNQLSNHWSGDPLEWQLEYVLANRHIHINQTNQNPQSHYVEPKTKWKTTKLSDQMFFAEKIEG